MIREWQVEVYRLENLCINPTHPQGAYSECDTCLPAEWVSPVGSCITFTLTEATEVMANILNSGVPGERLRIRHIGTHEVIPLGAFL